MYRNLKSNHTCIEKDIRGSKATCGWEQERRPPAQIPSAMAKSAAALCPELGDVSDVLDMPSVGELRKLSDSGTQLGCK